MRRLALAADTDREMSTAREDPDISVQLRQKLDVDLVPLAGDVVAEGGHGILSRQLRADIPQWIPGAGRDHAEIGVERAGFRFETPAVRLAFDIQHACLLDLRASALGALEQQPVQ